MNDISWKNPQVRQLVNAFKILDSSTETEAFLRDLLTTEEIMEFARRLETARLLANKAQYKEINKKTGLSTATIARISKWLRGPLGGYRTILGKLSVSRPRPSVLEKEF